VWPLEPVSSRSLTSRPQLAENTTILSSAFATLTIRVKVNPFVCHWVERRGPRAENKAVTETAFIRFRGPQALKDTYRKHPGRGTSASFLCVSSAYSASQRYLFLSSTAVRCKLAVVSSPRVTPNSFVIRTSKTRCLKSFRICTYKKRGRGPHPSSQSLLLPLRASSQPGHQSNRIPPERGTSLPTPTKHSHPA
jgi:hypothetical protein